MALDVDVSVTSRTLKAFELAQDLGRVADQLSRLPEDPAVLVLEAQLALVEYYRVDRRMIAYLWPWRLVVQPGALRLLVDEVGVQLDLK